MNRRHFLGVLASSAAALLLDPERLAWKPGAKTIFLPPEKKDVGFAFHKDAFSLTFMMEHDFQRRFIQPAVEALANKIDAQGLALFNQRFPARVDVLYGLSVVRPELALRVAG